MLFALLKGNFEKTRKYMNNEQIYQLQQLLLQQLNYHTSSNFMCKKMSGGAIQENWLIHDEGFDLVLRKNAESSVSVSSDRELEYQLLSRLHQLDIKVPKTFCFVRNPNFLNSDFFIMKKINGVAEGHKLVRIDNPKQRKKIVQDIAKSLAQIHQIHADNQLEQFLPKPSKNNYLENKIIYFREQLDALDTPRPIIEYAITWMSNHLPKVDDLVLVHGDFRTGNIMIDEDQVSGILDWEFTQWGDRREDIGWFTAKCWRFGRDNNVAGGIGDYKDFAQAYADVCDVFIPEFELKFWHILSHVRWAIIAMQQSNRNDDMTTPSLELALTEFMVPGIESNILQILGEQR